MVARVPVTLQISLAPSDHRLAEVLLPHQIKAWRSQVDEVLITIDTHRSRGRFGEGWEVGRKRIFELAALVPGARVVEIDYSAEARTGVAKIFFGGAPVPLKDLRGGPYYTYFFALYSAKHDWVLHTDADMFFGGPSSTWISEAIDLQLRTPDILFSAPLPGPPKTDGTLRQLSASPSPINGNAGFAFHEMSTRVFFVNKARLREKLGPLRPRAPTARGRFLALVEGNPAQMLPEDVISATMRERGMRRVDFLGTPPGRWSLHPPYRCADFYAKLPQLVARVESGDIPDAQFGDHDLNDSLVDWSEARTRLAHRRWWRRLGERIFQRNAS